MALKTISTRRPQRIWDAFTLVELLMATGLFSMVALVLASVFMFGLRSFSSLANYAVLDMSNRQAMDKLTSEIRQAWNVTAYSTNPPSLSILNGDGVNVTYAFDAASHTLQRRTSDGSRQVVVDNCDLLNFNLYQRNPSNANFGVFPLGTGDWVHSIKVVVLSWRSSITNGNSSLGNSENIQTARIVIRKQH